MPFSPEVTYEADLYRSLPVQPPAFEDFFTRVERTSNALQPVREKQYDRAGIGAVISGGFDYRGQTGAANGVPGTVFFGNLGEHFSVEYLDSEYTNRLVVWFRNEFLENVAEAYDLKDSRFRVVAIPPGKSALGLLAKMKALARGSHDSEDVACALVAAALTVCDDPQRSKAISNRDRQRIFSVVRFIGSAFGESCSVETLASVSGLSRYHFMRLFKAVTGQSANQYVINTRLRAAVARITETKAPISEIALDVGFNDISHFNTCFRAMFDCTPRQMRKLVRAA